MLFSPFFVSWHVLVMRAVLWSSAPIALVIAPIKRFLRGTTGAIFFTDFHLNPSHHSAACLLTVFCYPITLISISPRSSPRYPRHGGRGWHGCDANGGRRDILLASCGRRWMATWAEGRRCHDCLISLARCHPSHEMIGRLNCDVGGCPLSFFARPPLPCSSRFACLNCSPAPGRREEPAMVDWRLRALGRSACFSSRRAALSLSLVRYCGSVRPAVRCRWAYSILRLKRFNAAA